MAVKKSFQSVVAFLEANSTLTAEAILSNPEFTKLVEAKKGGFSGEDMFVTIDGQKVARVCAITGAVYTHNNEDKEASFFYKNGSYMIGAEIVKSNARKAWEAGIQAEEEALEAEMLDGDIEPKEWKEKVLALQAKEFVFTITDEQKQGLIDAFNGYIVLNEDGTPNNQASKEAWTKAYEAGDIHPFTDYKDQVEALRAETYY